MNYKTSQNGINLVASNEGLRLNSYQDSGGIWTIGYGTINYPDTSKVGEGETITIEQAKEYLAFELTNTERYINQLSLNINQNQFDALVDTVYNIGIGHFIKSDLYKKIKEFPMSPMINIIFPQTCIHDANGNELQGLINRRKKASILYFT
jgi:lysozyme